MQGIKLKSFELTVLLQFYFHSMDIKTYPRNTSVINHPDIFAFWNGKNKLLVHFENIDQYEKAFDKLINLGLIKDWGSFQHLTSKGVEYIETL